MGRTQKYVPPARRFSQPVVIALRQYHHVYDSSHRPIPVDRVPVHERSGELTIIYALAGLVIDGSETGNVYPQSATFEYNSGCEAFVEVYPRGRSKAEYERWRNDSQVRVVPLSAARGYTVISERPSVRMGSSHRSGSSLYHMRLLQPSQLVQYLAGVLPRLGVDATDVDPATQRVRALLQQGKRRIDELTRR